MKKAGWKARIKKNCRENGTYRPCFDSVIDTLAQTLDVRDASIEQYIAEGSKPIVIHTNQRGSENPVKNPLLVLIGDLNAQALTYWRELGLTPAGLKKLNEQAIKLEGTKSTLESALDKLL